MPQVEELLVFLASPGDILTERRYVEKIVADLNRTVASDKGLVLQVKSWENDAFPGYGEDAQALINPQIAEMSKYVRFVGIMWNRLGTPTPRAASGTVEEFKLAVEAFKQKGQPDIWFYFRQSASKLDTEDQLEQRKKVLAFKKEVQANGMPWTYRNSADFREKFRNQMILWLNARARTLESNAGLRDKLKDGLPKLPSVEQQNPMLERDTVFRDTLRDGSREPEMVVIPAGTFKMGDIQEKGGDHEKPVHTVNIPKSFAIGRYPITSEEYEVFASATGCHWPTDPGWDRHGQPAIRVTWYDAEAYAKWLSLQTGKRYRLPTEAEWEYAARAGTETNYWWGNEMRSDMANCHDGHWSRRGKTTVPVGSFPSNPFGLYDMTGNVWEWVEDCWHENYNDAPTDGSAWLASYGSACRERVMRGGSWNSSSLNLRTSCREKLSADYRGDGIGFRLAQDID
jgi:formylglycine-generating enzyme required for sulfatase activity